ncbi:hypothetical protein JNK13_01870 [bacterium]|nr:hypothetical protein [bacterium]
MNDQGTQENLKAESGHIPGWLLLLLVVVMLLCYLDGSILNLVDPSNAPHQSTGEKLIESFEAGANRFSRDPSLDGISPEEAGEK